MGPINAPGVTGWLKLHEGKLWRDLGRTHCDCRTAAPRPVDHHKGHKIKWFGRSSLSIPSRLAFLKFELSLPEKLTRGTV